MPSSDDAQLLQGFPNVWRGSDIASAGMPASATGFTALDCELPAGGWPGGALTEILYVRSGIGELQLLLPALARLSREGRRQIWIAPPHVPYAPALVQAQIDPSRLVVLTPSRRRDMLWAAEQALRSAACGAVLMWPAAVKDSRPLRYAEVRRLQIAVQGSETLAFIFRPETESKEPSSAVLRLALAGTANAKLAVHILKRRGAVLEAPVIVDARAAPSGLIQQSNRSLQPALDTQYQTDHVMARHPFSRSPARVNIAGELLS